MVRPIFDTVIIIITIVFTDDPCFCWEIYRDLTEMRYVGSGTPQLVIGFVMTAINSLTTGMQLNPPGLLHGI